MLFFMAGRRVVKTTLMNEFLKDKKSVYYMAVEGTKSGNLAASYPAISSMIQSHIDHCWKESCLFFILCGSSMSFMEEQVLGYKSPLYGRRTAQFKIHPFTYFEAKEMLSSYTNEEQAVLYGVTGGIPEFDEPSNLLKQELRESCYVSLHYFSHCRRSHQYLFLPQVYASIPFPIGNLGRWWGNNARKKCQEEIDFMSVYDNHAFFGECKWKNSLVGTDVIHTLQANGDSYFLILRRYFIYFLKVDLPRKL